MNPQHVIVTGAGAAPTDSVGYPWTARYTIASGNLLADFRFNVTAESQGRLQVSRLYQLTDDPGVRDMLSFLLARDTMHQNKWLAAIKELEEEGLEMTPCPSNFPQELELREVSYQFLNFSEGEESSQGRWANGPSVDGKGRIEYVSQPPAIGDVPELGVVDPRLQGTPKQPHKPRVSGRVATIRGRRSEPSVLTDDSAKVSEPYAVSRAGNLARDTAGVHKTRAAPGRPPHVVIVGAGFAGLAAAKRLARAPVDVTVIDRRNHHLFQPLLYQVATAALSPAEIAAPIRAVLAPYRNVQVHLDEVIGVAPDTRQVITKDSAGQSYDYLILATGSAYAYFGHEDWPRFAPGLKSVEDATAIRRQLLLAFERAESVRDAALRERLLTFVLIGGGPTGVELAGAIAELAKATLARDFRQIDPKSARILLIEAGPRVLPTFPEKLSAYAASALARMGVEVRLGSMVEHIDEDGVIAGGERIKAATVIWSAGVQATPVGQWLGVRTARNEAVPVDPDLSVPAFPEIFVLGDAALVPGSDGIPLPGLAAVAQQQGYYVGSLIAGRVAGRAEPGPFVYRDRGTMATIGRSAAVADFGAVQLTGYGAWLLWGLVHIYLLIGFRNRLAVFVNWIWSWLTYGRGARLITGPVFDE